MTPIMMDDITEKKKLCEGESLMDGDTIILSNKQIDKVFM